MVIQPRPSGPRRPNLRPTTLLGRLALPMLLLAAGACRSQSDAIRGPADSYRIVAPVAGAGTGTASAPAPVAVVEPGDARLGNLEGVLMQGFAAEMMRTTFLAKQAVRDLDVGGKRHPRASSAEATMPTVLLLGASTGTGQGLSLPAAFLGKPESLPEQPWVGIAANFADDKALIQTLSGLLATRAARLVAGVENDDSLVQGYAWAMETIAREWRQGEGEGTKGLMPRDAGTRQQKERFAAVRENSFVRDHLKAAGAEPSGASPAHLTALVNDPGVAAAVLYRMVQQKSIGPRVGPTEIYAPFARNADRLPAGVSPAAVLGPLRNFQAKLFVAWATAVAAGRPPRDIVDLVLAYGQALPDERADVIRLFVVTTYGATVKPGGVSLAPADADKIVPELTALSAEVTAGKRSLRDAWNAPAATGGGAGAGGAGGAGAGGAGGAGGANTAGAAGTGAGAPVPAKLRP